ncbi:hypothetical protein [Nocardioides soli]|uniref:Uncharacterized protein n=1 Tax=Nocardioides soli TaxID=1036020 RepID=A0A7W4VW63_9ACTN|nr:hypothetical protein [Nocardioides soli]MBB3042891.1 hypothetical protein [Nocardioides soli]
MGMLPQYAMPGPAAASFQPAFRERYGVGGECYNRCMLYCSGPACDWICSFICEHAPVTTRPVDPVFLTR